MTNKNLSPPTRLTASAAALYTNSSGKPAKVTNAVFCNTSSTKATITIYHVPDGDTADGDTTIISAQKIEGGETYIAVDLIGMVIEDDGAIHGESDTASVITADISGTEG